VTYPIQTVYFEEASLGALNPIPSFKGLPRIKAFPCVLTPSLCELLRTGKLQGMQRDGAS
jgi:hypothetical protein